MIQLHMSYHPKECVGGLHPNKSASLDNYLPGPTSIGESNNPSAPQLWGLYPLDQQGGLTSTQLWGLFP